eukprot:475073_1
MENSNNLIFQQTTNQIECASENQDAAKPTGITEKKDENCQDACQEKYTFDDLHQNMINEIASCLPLKSYLRFQCVNRNINIWMKNVPTLYSLTGYDAQSPINNYMLILSDDFKIPFMQRFNKIKRLSIMSWSFDFVKVVTWKDVKELIIEHDILEIQDTFVKNDSFSWDSINKLRIVDNYYHENRSNIIITISLCDFIGKFRDIQFLSLDLYFNKLNQAYYHNISQIAFKLKQLKHLCLGHFPKNKTTSFLHKLSERLESLHINLCDRLNRTVYPSFDELSFPFTTLQNLYLHSSLNAQRMTNIIVKTSNLQNLRIDSLDESTNLNGFDEFMRQSFELKSLKSLTFPDIHASLLLEIIYSINTFIESTNIHSEPAILMHFTQDYGISTQEIMNTPPKLEQLCLQLDKWSQNKFKVYITMFHDDIEEIAKQISHWKYVQQSKFVMHQKTKTIEISSSSNAVYISAICQCCKFDWSSFDDS